MALETRHKSDLLLEVKNLKVSFSLDEGRAIALNGISFAIQRGRTLGIVGESGSGKSICAKSILRLLPSNAGIDPTSSIHLYRGKDDVVDITQLKSTGREIARIRGNDIAMVFQEPMSSFSPVYTIGQHIVEAILAHQKMRPSKARKLAIDLLNKVGIANPTARVDQYPFELSGGMRQRAMIAIALSSYPALLIADEPTTALDVTLQAQILALIKQLQSEFNMAMIFITHDIGVIAEVTDEIAVMYLGHIVEHGKTREVLRNPQHPYTKALLNAIPKLDTFNTRLIPVGGDVPGLLERPKGCPFHPRCVQRIAGVCDDKRPAATLISETHSVSCFLHGEVVYDAP